MTNSDRLSGVRAKIERAKHHVDDLCTSVEAFRKRNPDLIVHEINPQTGAQIFRVKISEPIPLVWSMMIGDCAHNLRTALDYIIIQTVLLKHRQTTRRTGFPIGPSREKFESDLAGKIKGASQKVAKLLGRLKPYKGGCEPFWIISELDITDKHQTIIPVWAGFPLVEIFKTVADTRTNLGSAHVFPVDNGTVLISTTDNHGNYDIEFTFEVAFAKGEVLEGEPIIPTLYQLVQFTDRVVDIFARHIFRGK